MAFSARSGYWKSEVLGLSGTTYRELIQARSAGPVTSASLRIGFLPEFNDHEAQSFFAHGGSLCQ